MWLNDLFHRRAESRPDAAAGGPAGASSGDAAGGPPRNGRATGTTTPGSPAWMNDRVEAYVDGDLDAADRALFERVLAQRAHWQRQVAQAERIAATLRAMPQPACPAHVADAVLRHARRTSGPGAGAAPDEAPGAPEAGWMHDRVEAYVDGDLAPGEAAAFAQHLAASPRWQQEVARAERIAATLRALPQPACPEHVADAVLRQARRAGDRPPAARAARRHTGWAHRAWRALQEPAVDAVALVLVAAAVLFLVQPFGDDGAPASFAFEESMTSSLQAPYSDAEVRTATEQARAAVALVARAGRTTGATVRDDVFRKHLAPAAAAPGAAAPGTASFGTASFGGLHPADRLFLRLDAFGPSATDSAVAPQPTVAAHR